MKKILCMLVVVFVCSVCSAQTPWGLYRVSVDNMSYEVFEYRQDMQMIFGQDENGASKPVSLTGKKINTVSQPYTYAISEGDVPNHTPVRRFGLNASVGTSIETIDSTSDLFVYLTTGETLEITSGSANDTLLGTGAQKVVVYGLTADYVLTNEVVNLDGATAVYTDIAYMRVLAFYDYAVGTGGQNAGIISLKNNAGTNTIHIIPAGEGRSNFAMFTVPAGYTLYVTNWYGSENSTKGTSVSYWAREYGDGGWRQLRLYVLLDNLFENNLLTPLRFPEKTDIQLRGKAVLSGANVAAGFYGWMELND